MFVRKKLDDLLILFGGRYCKSMIDLSTGWSKEADPRLNITWPLSPNKKKEYDGDYKFTMDDMFGEYNNVYAEAKKPKVYPELSVQADAPMQDFIHLLHRKQGDTLSSLIKEDDEVHLKIKSKLRGRQNKYQRAVDNEDQEENDLLGHRSIDIDNTANDDSITAIIREQEEEEELLRIKVQEERIRLEAQKVERRARLAEEERKKKEAEAAAELARKKADEEEERLAKIREQELLI